VSVHDLHDAVDGVLDVAQPAECVVIARLKLSQLVQRDGDLALMASDLLSFKAGLVLVFVAVGDQRVQLLEHEARVSNRILLQEMEDLTLQLVLHPFLSLLGQTFFTVAAGLLRCELDVIG